MNELDILQTNALLFGGQKKCHKAPRTQTTAASTRLETGLPMVQADQGSSIFCGTYLHLIASVQSLSAPAKAQPVWNRWNIPVVLGLHTSMNWWPNECKPTAGSTETKWLLLEVHSFFSKQSIRIPVVVLIVLLLDCVSCLVLCI